VSRLSSAALVLGASVSYAAATLYLRTKLRDAPALGVVTGALLTATLLTSPLAVIETSSRGLPSDASLAVLVALGVLCSGVAFHLYYLLVAEAGAARAALNTYLSPAIAVCSGVLVLGEPLEAGMVAGLLLVLAGCWLTAGGPPPQSRLALARRPRTAAARARERVRRWNMTSIGGFQ